ncbi:hypothetical protein [Bifidobacterium margollesii]|nr:hypothetical protein [Bifidobacterium margollesii]
MDDPNTAERETRALWELMEEQHLDEGFIIVGNGKERDWHNPDHANQIIHQIPAWRWLMDTRS